MFGMTAGYTFLLLALTMYFVTQVALNTVQAWKARGVERERTRQAEIKAGVKRAELDARLVERWRPPQEIDPPKNP